MELLEEYLNLVKKISEKEKELKKLNQDLEILGKKLFRKK